MRDKLTEEEVKEMTESYDTAIRALQRLENFYGEHDLGLVIIPVLKARRTNLRKFLEG